MRLTVRRDGQGIESGLTERARIRCTGGRASPRTRHAGSRVGEPDRLGTPPRAGNRTQDSGNSRTPSRLPWRNLRRCWPPRKQQPGVSKRSIQTTPPSGTYAWRGKRPSPAHPQVQTPSTSGGLSWTVILWLLLTNLKPQVSALKPQASSLSPHAYVGHSAGKILQAVVSKAPCPQPMGSVCPAHSSRCFAQSGCAVENLELLPFLYQPE